MDEMKNMKKYDLHCHLDGSLSIGTMRKLAECVGKELVSTIWRFCSTSIWRIAHKMTFPVMPYLSPAHTPSNTPSTIRA